MAPPFATILHYEREWRQRIQLIRLLYHTYLNINSVLWFVVHIILFFHHVELEANMVDWDGVFSSEVLSSSYTKRRKRIR